MRALSSSIMAALVVVALFWGNCFSCPQMMLSFKTHKASHDCCKRGQKPAKASCSSQGMQHFVKAEMKDGAQPALHSAPVEVAVAAAPVWHAVEALPAEATHAPPDLLALHSSFRI